MKKFGLGNLLKANQRDGETNEASSEVTNDADVDEKGETVITDDTEEENNKKQMFAAYVDALTLKWNLHFVPQSLLPYF